MENVVGHIHLLVKVVEIGYMYKESSLMSTPLSGHNPGMPGLKGRLCPS
jgi:hypothetical protein